MRHRVLRGLSAGALALLAAMGCASVLPSRQASRELPEAALQRVLTRWEIADTVSVLGFRDRYGKVPPSAELLESALLSALARDAVVIHPHAGILSEAAPTMRFSGSRVLPQDWAELAGEPGRGLVLGGQLREEEQWMYLRLTLADAATGALVQQGVARLAASRIDELMAAAEENSAAVNLPIEIDYHVVAKREESGFVERIELSEGATLVEGDRVQIRLRSAQDCEVFAFIYASGAGERDNLIGPERVYADRWMYAPGENSWVTLEGDEVYTIYLLVAPRIPEDQTALWDDVAQWQRQGVIDRMQGLDLIDGALTQYLQTGVSGVDSVQVERGEKGIVFADETEDFAYRDGSVIKSRGQQLKGVVILRAISFSARWK